MVSNTQVTYFFDNLRNNIFILKENIYFLLAVDSKSLCLNSMLVVFDLDFTLWDCGGTWCDHTNPPFYRSNGIIRDEDNRKIQLYPDVKLILENLKKRDVQMGVASRTGAPDWADELMQLFHIKNYFDHFEIYPGSKLTHFRSLQEKTGLPYQDMIFFDDEYRNIEEVERLGVEAVFVEDGITMEVFNKYVPLD